MCERVVDLVECEFSQEDQITNEYFQSEHQEVYILSNKIGVDLYYSEQGLRSQLLGNGMSNFS